MTRYASPLRYPGGKSKLLGFVKRIIRDNGLVGGHYAEPYAGGASVAIGLLLADYATRIHINDLDPAIYAFWHSVLYETSGLCRLIHDTPVSPAEWRRQRAVQGDPDADTRSRGFSTFFLNRTNRSGIITGGMIGGTRQRGTWRLDARYNSPELIQRIETIALFAGRIALSNLDANQFLRARAPELPQRSLVYLDPPYYIPGQQRLYANYYVPADHAGVAAEVGHLDRPWIVSYDDAPEIRRLYAAHRRIVYGLDYSAADRYQGAEVMFFSGGLVIPKTKNPVDFGRRAG